MKHQQSNSVDIKDLIPKLNQIVTAVSHAVETGTLEEILKNIADYNRSLVNARFAAIGIPDSSGHFLYFQISGLGNQERDRLKEELPAGLGLLNLIMDEKRPLLVDTILSSPASIGLPESHPELKHLMGVPIRIGNQLLGILYLMDRKDGEPFSETDLLITEIMAGYVALAIAGNNLSIQKEQIALLEERERIAMELHDGIIQSLYGIGMQVEIAREEGEFQEEKIREVVKSLDDVINDIRYTIRDLRKNEYRKQTLRESLNDTISRLHIPPTISLVIETSQTATKLKHSQMETIGHIITESVSNAVRHGEATEIIIHAEEDDRLFTLTINDDGKGFDPDVAELSNEGMGLRNIRHRVALLDGKITINSSREKGTLLKITLPIR